MANKTNSQSSVKQAIKSVIQKTVTICATFGGVGYSWVMPGTMGSFATLVVAFAVQFNILYMAIMFMVSTIVGAMVSGSYAKRIKKQDPKEVVIDEVSGMFMILWLCGLYKEETFAVIKHYIPNTEIITAWQNDALLSGLSFAIPAFILFRLFDIIKPFPISYIDKHIKGSLGIMLDDILAAFFGTIVFVLSILMINANINA